MAVIRSPVVVALVALVALTASTTSSTTSTTSATSPPVVAPPREVSPFSSRNDFCTTVDTKFKGLKSTGPGVTKDAITVVMLAPSVATDNAAAGETTGDPVDEARVFSELVNECGGINGRRLDFHIIVEGSDPQADCIQATEDLHAFIVITWNSFGAESCVTNDHHTILVTMGSPQSNATLAQTHGRLITTDSSEGVVQARVLDLVGSGRLDDTKVGILLPSDFPNGERVDEHLKQLLQGRHINVVFDDYGPSDAAGGSAPDPSAVVGRLERSGAKALITAGISSTLLELLQGDNHPLAIYDLAASSEGEFDDLRQSGGTTLARFVNDVGVYTWTAVGEQNFRVDPSPGEFTTTCNRAYVTFGHPDLASKNVPAPSSTVAGICLAFRIVARALVSAGVNATQRTAVRALHTLPYVEDTAGDGARKPRPNQVINEPVTQVQRVVVLDKAEYPCRHPTLPKDPASYRVCLVPVQGWDDGGHAVNGPLWPD